MSSRKAAFLRQLYREPEWWRRWLLAPLFISFSVLTIYVGVTALVRDPHFDARMYIFLFLGVAFLFSYTAEFLPGSLKHSVRCFGSRASHSSRCR